MGAALILHDGLRREASDNGVGILLVGRKVGGDGFGEDQGGHGDELRGDEVVRMRPPENLVNALECE